jgi:hypothetical protein
MTETQSSSQFLTESPDQFLTEFHPPSTYQEYFCKNHKYNTLLLLFSSMLRLDAG